MTGTETAFFILAFVAVCFLFMIMRFLNDIYNLLLKRSAP